jgi:hypothetical protein
MCNSHKIHRIHHVRWNTEQSPSSEIDILSASQENSYIFCGIRRLIALFTIASQWKQSRARWTNTNHGLSLPNGLSLLQVFRPKYSTQFSSPRVCYMARPFHYPWFDRPSSICLCSNYEASHYVDKPKDNGKESLLVECQLLGLLNYVVK